MRFYFSDPNKIIRYFAYFLELFILCVIQDIPGIVPKIFGSVPLMTLSAVMSISAIEEEVPSILFGLECGLLLDVTSGSPFGSCALVFVVVCGLTSAFAHQYKKRNIFNVMFVTLISTFVIIFGIWFINIVATRRSSIYYSLITTYIPLGIYSYLIIPIFYLINSGLHKGLGDRII